MASAAESFRRFIKGRDRDRRVGDFSADRALTKFRTARKSELLATARQEIFVVYVLNFRGLAKSS